ncbi:glycosyltransferase family 2 protein [Patescibacteria group bacterium]|nr:glycosyltransferase family 2 protein [Patescibacteria group bacterium]
MKPKPSISAVINTRNESENLTKCLKSLAGFADEIIVVDMHSSDDSVGVAKSFGAKVYPFRLMKVVEPARNFGISKVTGKWVILLDPDETLPKSLKEELLKITNRNDIDFVKIPRKNIIFHKWLRHSKMWPDYLIRFFKNGHVHWLNEVHSQPTTEGNGLNLLDSEKLAIRHINYSSINSFFSKALRYASARSEELIAQDYKIKTSDFLLKPIQEFNSRFFTASGFKDGLHGLIFSILQAISIELIYIKIWEKQGFQDKPLPKESFVSASQETVYEYSYWFTKYFTAEYTANILKTFFVRVRHYFDRLTKNF